MSTRDKLLASFDGKPGQILSGEVLARRLGVSRTAVWKQLQSIQSVGVPIESVGRQGYRLMAPFDSSLVDHRPPRGFTAHYQLSTSSTQTLAKAGAQAGLPEGHVWIAETQRKGRGRLDRPWESTYGGLWFSLLIRPKMPASRVPPLTLLAGLCLRDSVEEVCGIKAVLKWPNDLLVESTERRAEGEAKFKKLAGILTEMSGQMDRTEWVVIGVGLNVNNPLSKGLTVHAASLYDVTGHVGRRAMFLDVFLKMFRVAYDRYQKEGLEPFRRAYWSHYFAPDQTVHLKTAGGMLSGVARGVDDSGAIMIESRRKIVAISEGEIIY